ncbi:MAG: hypothetical protein ACREQA_15740 [Candidatus Binatia bacterium]
MYVREFERLGQSQDIEDQKREVLPQGVLKRAGLKTTSRVDGKTAMALQTALEQSLVLRPFIATKLATITIPTNFFHYGFDEEFSSKYLKLHKIVVPFGSKEEKDLLNIRAFYDRPTDSIHLRPYTNLGQALHMAIRKFSSPAFRNFFGKSLDDGLSLYFANLVLEEQALAQIVPHPYKDQLRCATNLVGLVGRNMAGKAYFENHSDLVDHLTTRLSIGPGQLASDALCSCPRAIGGCEYPLLPIPPSLRGPSGEPGQILLDGKATKITLYHGFYTEFLQDRELDWHVHIVLPKSTKDTLIAHLRAATGCNVTDKDLEDFSSEHMVLDSPNEFVDDQAPPRLGYRSADVSLPLRLRGSEHPAWDLGLIAARHSHEGKDFTKYSRLRTDSGYVYLQGAFVNDAYHGPKLEIHPLDSIAYALDAEEKIIPGKPYIAKTIPVKYGQEGWPNKSVRWRVAVFTNSNLHRINKCSYLQKERTTTWYLDLPSDAYSNQSGRAKKVNVVPIRHKLWNGVQRAWYESRGVKSIVRTLKKDPRDGRMKLKIIVTMKAPDKLGGMWVCDFLIQT